MKNKMNTQSEKVITTVSDDIKALQEKKMEVWLSDMKAATYIKDRVYKYRKEWWDKWLEMLHAKDKDLNKVALIEFNKLQWRVLPTQLEWTAGQQIMVNVIGMWIETPPPEPAVEWEYEVK